MEEQEKVRIDSIITKFSLTNYSEKIKEVSDSLITVINNFYYSLSTNWYSSKAVDFSSSFTGLIDDLSKSINDYYKDNVDGVCNSFNELATKHDKKKIEFQGSLDLKLYYPLLLTQGPNGTLGMNINNVKRAVNDFIEGIDEVVGKCEQIPSYVVLSKYANGSKNYYFTKPDILKNNVKDITSKMVNQITSYINQEVDNVNKASMLAVEDLK